MFNYIANKIDSETSFLRQTLENKTIVRVLREELKTREITFILGDGSIIKIDAEGDDAAHTVIELI